MIRQAVDLAVDVGKRCRGLVVNGDRGRAMFVTASVTATTTPIAWSSAVMTGHTSRRFVTASATATTAPMAWSSAVMVTAALGGMSATAPATPAIVGVADRRR
jgi:hypothetical protein